MATEERTEENLYIEKKRRSEKFFITGSNVKGGANKTTIDSSVFTEMSKSFAEGDHLTDLSTRTVTGPVLYMLQQMEDDLNSVYNEVSASAFEASFFPFATIDSGSFGVISSSLIPDIDNKYDLGSSGKEWNDLYVDGTAYVDAINYQGTALAPTITELNYVDGVSSAIQTQLNARLLKSGGAMTGAITTNSTFDGVDIATRDAILTSTTTTAKAALPKTGGTMTGLIKPIVQTVNGAKLANPHDVRAIDIIEIAAGGKAWTLTTARSAHPGQKLTIIALTVGKVVHGRGNAATQFQCVGGRDLTVAINTAVTFIANSNGIWYQVV
tara:strand:- start:13 stop:990 length:978 start_codon:yes stop_codon:yes gene_type:complete